MSPLIKDGDIVLYDEFKSPLFPDVTCSDMTSERRGGKISSLSPLLERREIKRGILKRGDMIAYMMNDEIYIHRIISIKNDRFIVSNDDDLEKHTIEKEQILGRLVNGYNGFLGYFLHIFLRNMRQVFRKAKG